MSLFAALSLIIAVAALFSFVNYRFIGLPTTIGVTLIALMISLAIILAGSAGLPVRFAAVAFLRRLDFRVVVLDGVLAFLLFAGALNVDFEELMGHKLTVAILATAGVLMSTVMVGGLTWVLSRSLGLGLGLMDSLPFGALISPTDPIAVLGILRATSAPRDLQAQMAGESLFNDGIGVVVFSVLLTVVERGHGSHGAVSAGTIGVIFVREMIGSLVIGLVVGWLTFRMLRSVDNYQVEVLLTLALSMGVYSLASALHTSGPLAVVAAGLLIGGSGRKHAMSQGTVEHLDTFWELIDEILNVVLFLLIGFEMLLVPLTVRLLLMGAGAVFLVLLGRWLSVGAAVAALRRFRTFQPHVVKVLTWGGLRGGLSIAMALSLPPSLTNGLTIQALTYVVALFSIAVQGLTFGRLLRAAGASGLQPNRASTS